MMTSNELKKPINCIIVYSPFFLREEGTNDDGERNEEIQRSKLKIEFITRCSFHRGVGVGAKVDDGGTYNQ